jgi:Tfp pilus assembly ATPase PilU
MQTSKNQGMTTLNDALIQLLDQKLIEPREAFFRAVDRAGIRQALAARGHDADALAAAAT